MTTNAVGGKVSLSVDCPATGICEFRSPMIDIVPKSQERYFWLSAYVSKGNVGNIRVEMDPNGNDNDYQIQTLLEKKSESGSDLNSWTQIYKFVAINGKVDPVLGALKTLDKFQLKVVAMKILITVLTI